jgi:hypothetical protein
MVNTIGARADHLIQEPEGIAMAALSIRRLCLMYKRIIIREGLGITRRNHVQILAQNIVEVVPTCRMN